MTSARPRGEVSLVAIEQELAISSRLCHAYNIKVFLFQTKTWSRSIPLSVGVAQAAV